MKDQKGGSRQRAREVWIYSLWSLVLALVILGVQYRRGAFVNEYGARSDEAAHYVTGMMMRDFLWSRQWDSPVRFAEEFYSHYPKVAIGNWPPCFYIQQGLWFSTFGPSRRSAMFLMLVTTLLTALVLAIIGSKCWGPHIGLAGAVLYALLPITATSYCVLMSEMFMTLWCLLAAVVFHRYLKQPTWAGGLVFAVLTTLAIMTKGSGFLLVLYVLVLIATSRSWFILRHPSLYFAAGVVAILCVPWYLSTIDVARSGWASPTPGIHFTWKAAAFYPAKLIAAFGLGGPLLIAGLTYVIIDIVGRRPLGILHSMACLLIAVLLFHLVVPCGTATRHLMPAVPAGVLLVVLGLSRMLGWVCSSAAQAAPVTFLVTLILLVAPCEATLFHEGEKEIGFRRIAEDIMPSPEDRILCLVSSDEHGEGMLIAEFARLDSRSRRTHILRASKTLLHSGWNGKNVKVLLAGKTEIREFLQGLAVDYIVFDTSVKHADESARQHQELRAVLENESFGWKRVAWYPRTRRGFTSSNAIHLYQHVSGETRKRRELQITVSGNRTITVDLP